MTPQEAIEKLKGMQRADTEDIIGRLGNKYIGGKKYESVYDLAINALEKQILKKPIEKVDLFSNRPFYICPSCGKSVYEYYPMNMVTIMEHHCTCGQAIDWESDNQ